MQSLRWQALDIVKAVGVLLMVIVHVVVWWHVPFDYGASEVEGIFYFFLPFLKLIGLFVVILPITAGSSLRFYLERQKSKKEKMLGVIKRSAGLIAIGYLMNLLAFGYGEFLDWDVLQFIGVGFLIIAFMYIYSGIGVVLAAGAIALFSAPYLRFMLDSWNLNYFVAALISNNEGTFFWPLFPWLSFIAYGFLMADIYINGRNIKKFYSIISILSVFILVAAAYRNELLVRPAIANIWGPSIFQAPALTLLGDISVFSLFLICTDAFLKRMKRGGKKIRVSKFGFINAFSRGIFWIYLIHIVVGYRLVNFVQKFSKSVYAMLIVAGALLIAAYLTGAAVVWLKNRRH